MGSATRRRPTSWACRWERFRAKRQSCVDDLLLAPLDLVQRQSPRALRAGLTALGYSEALSNVAESNRDLAALAVFSARRWEFVPARTGDGTVPGEVILDQSALDALSDRIGNLARFFLIDDVVANESRRNQNFCGRHSALAIGTQPGAVEIHELDLPFREMRLETCRLHYEFRVALMSRALANHNPRCASRSGGCGTTYPPHQSER
jgi:hypothetical protein